MNRVPVFRATAFAAIMLLTGSSWAQSVVQVAPGRVSVEANGTPLITLMNELAEMVTVETLLIDSSTAELRVTIKLEDVPVGEAIEKILEAAKVNYTVWGGDGEPFRIFAGPPEGEVAPDRFAEQESQERQSEGQATHRREAPTREATIIVPREEEPFAPVPGQTPPTGEVQAIPAVPRAAPPLEARSPVSGEARRLPPPTTGRPAGPEKAPGAQARPGEPPPIGRQGATATAVFVTDGASVNDEPGSDEVALTAGILSLGLLLGLALVRR